LGDRKLKRNFDAEISDVENSKYGYNFDIDVMHPLMIRSMLPFFQGESILELGSYKGQFTNRLMEHFKSITCIEASNEAIKEARKTLPRDIQIIQGSFEEVKLEQKFDLIVMTHVLEHLDNPEIVLKRIKKEWLNRDGKLIIVVPNANAISRQIAVEMGIIESSTSITESEYLHGHRATFNLETLNKIVRNAKLDVVSQTGIFLKSFANFQWDLILKEEIVGQEYLDGCYVVGQKYPDLCASLMLVCK
jgi:2-polyprenyl-3-methyl-5-hydroxy-6-metoxy-1,4-benzoquinol methylase